MSVLLQRTAGVVLVLLALVPCAWAQAENLRGLKTFALSIGPQSEASNRCGFTRQWLHTRAHSLLRSSTMVFVEIDHPPDALLEVNTTTLPGHCIASVSVDVSTYVQLTRSGRRGVATVWRVAAIGGDLAVQNNFDDLVKDLLRDWSAVNR